MANTKPQIEIWGPYRDGTFSVSSHGRVMRSKPGPRNRQLYIIKQQPSQSGYFRVCLRFGNAEQSTIQFVHRMVAEVFIGPLPDGLQVNHKDGDKTNNHATNLEYVTAKQNAQHASRMGLKPSGDRHYIVQDRERAPRGSALNKGHLVEADIRNIRSLRKNGKSPTELAKRFKVTPSTICKICLNQSWKHVK